MQTFYFSKQKSISAFLLGLAISLNFGCTIHQKASAIEEDLPLFCSELLERAREHTWERQYVKALGLLDEAECLKGNSPETHLMRADIFYTLERWQAAEEAYGLVLERAPKNHQAIVRLWFIDAIEQGFDKKAKEALKKKAVEYMGKDPGDPEVVYATVLGLEGARAVREKTRIIENYAHIVKNPFWRKELADIYFYDTLKIGDEALVNRARFFRKEFPRNRLRYNFAANVLSFLKNEDFDALQSEIRKILRKEPGNRVLNYLCAKAILDVNGDLDLASKYIGRAIKASSKPDPRDRYEFVDDATWDRLINDSRSAYYAINGRIKFLQGRNTDALEQLEKGLLFSPRNCDLYLWYAEALEKVGHLDEALRQYKRAAELSDSAEAVDGMQRILSASGIGVDPAEHFAVLEGIPRFTDVTDEAALRDCKSSRVAWSDLNQDGFPDLLIEGRYAFSNAGDGTFNDVTEQSGINHEHASGGVLADFNNDGLPDLMAFTDSHGPRLYLNKTVQGGTIRMEDVTETALPVWPGDTGPTEAAAAADVDGDGNVDVYFANFEKSGPERAFCSRDVFYLNLGDGTFEDATSHIAYLSQESMCGRGASFSDFNGDGRQDLYVANYRLDPDFLLVNDPGDEEYTFKLVDRAKVLGVRGRNVLGAYGHSIGGTWGYLGKNRPALFVASLAHPGLLGLSDTSMLYLPSPNDEGFDPHFEDFGIVYQETHSDPSFVDVDLDGDLDLFITSTYRDAPSFLYHTQDGAFVDVTWLAGARLENGWGAAWADYDKDGDMDVLVCSNGTPTLMRNEAQKFKRSWLEVRVAGCHSPRTGIGAKVTVQAINGDGHWVREIRAGRGTGNQDEAVAHFGLGRDEGPFKVAVRFTSGTEVILDEVPCCDIIDVIEP